MKINVRRQLVAAACIFCGLFSYAQTGVGSYGSYSPYTVYGVGDLSRGGTSFNQSMGGVGVATRNKRYINIMNPAAVTARDSLSFMVDFGLSGTNNVYYQNNLKSANNTFTMVNFVMSFPIWKSSAMMIGICPFSGVGYDFTHIEQNPDIIGQIGNITHQYYGQGTLNNLFISAGATFFKRVSVGAEMDFIFGTLNEYSNVIFAAADHRPLTGGYTSVIRGFTGKFGLQYEQPIGGKSSITVGATYRLASKINGEYTQYRFATASEIVDSVKINQGKIQDGNLRFGDELGVGINYRMGDKLSVEINYLRGNWSKTGMDSNEGFMVKTGEGKYFHGAVMNSLRAGVEFVPARNDVRYYFRKCAYRAGLYYESSYYTFDGYGVNQRGITLGMTFPIFKWYNGISVGVDVGSRGTIRNDMVREIFTTISVGFNIHDYWFHKHQYL